MESAIRLCQPFELDTLRAIGIETYDDTFREMNTPETMDQYLAEAFNPEKLWTEYTNPNSQFYFLFLDQNLAGYLKVNETPAQSDLNDPESLEVERFYIRKAYKGQGLGVQLMNYVFLLAQEKKKRFVWLGVWEKNTAAIAFYQKMGFKEAGRHSFRMGDELQTDWVMKKVL